MTTPNPSNYNKTYNWNGKINKIPFQAVFQLIDSNISCFAKNSLTQEEFNTKITLENPQKALILYSNLVRDIQPVNPYLTFDPSTVFNFSQNGFYLTLIDQLKVVFTWEMKCMNPLSNLERQTIISTSSSSAIHSSSSNQNSLFSKPDPPVSSSLQQLNIDKSFEKNSFEIPSTIHLISQSESFQLYPFFISNFNETHFIALQQLVSHNDLSRCLFINKSTMKVEKKFPLFCLATSDTVAHSHNKLHLAIADSASGIIHLYHVPTGLQIAQLDTPFPKNSIFCIEFSKDSRFLVVGLFGQISIVSVAKNSLKVERIHDLPQRNTVMMKISSLAFSPDSSIVYCGDSESKSTNQFFAIHSETGEVLYQKQIFETHNINSTANKSIPFSQTRSVKSPIVDITPGHHLLEPHILFISSGHTIFKFDTIAQQIVQSIHTKNFIRRIFVISDLFLATCFTDSNDIIIFNLSTEKKVLKNKNVHTRIHAKKNYGHSSGVYSMFYDKNSLFSCSKDSTIIRWSWDTSKLADDQSFTFIEKHDIEGYASTDPAIVNTDHFQKSSNSSNSQFNFIEISNPFKIELEEKSGKIQFAFTHKNVVYCILAQEKSKNFSVCNKYDALKLDFKGKLYLEPCYKDLTCVSWPFLISLDQTKHNFLSVFNLETTMLIKRHSILEDFKQLKVKAPFHLACTKKYFFLSCNKKVYHFEMSLVGLKFLNTRSFDHKITSISCDSDYLYVSESGGNCFLYDSSSNLTLKKKIKLHLDSAIISLALPNFKILSCTDRPEVCVYDSNTLKFLDRKLIKSIPSHLLIILPHLILLYSKKSNSLFLYNIFLRKLFPIPFILPKNLVHLWYEKPFLFATTLDNFLFKYQIILGSILPVGEAD